MDLTGSPTTKTPDSENDTPPQTRLKPLSFANGIRKHHMPPSAAAVVTVAYRECLKNHAASMGGHALDGCGEFMQLQDATAADPTSLKCAACGCHRNFHRRDPPDDYSFSSPTHTHISSPHFIDFRHPFRRRSSPSASPPPHHMLLALTTAAPPDDGYHHNNHLTPVTPNAAKMENATGRKRFRTKFSQEQKEKMQNFSEKLGWKMQKSDEAAVGKFCTEIGVSRGVLKVWMHNNKNTLGKKDGNGVVNGGSLRNDVVENENNNNNFNDRNASSSHCRNDQNISGGDLNLHIDLH